MHHVYKTEGIVLGGTNFGEANRYIHVFTRDLGMLSGSAQGVRLLKSKLRYGLQDFCYSTVALVKGKSMWRITNAVPKENWRSSFKADAGKRDLSLRIFLLLKRMLTGEEKNEVLFDLVRDSLLYLESASFSSDELKNFECVFVLRILENLGYLGENKNLHAFTENYLWSESVLKEMAMNRTLALAEINKSLKETHL